MRPGSHAERQILHEMRRGNPGRGAAVAVIMLLLMIPVMVLNIRRFKSERVMT